MNLLKKTTLVTLLLLIVFKSNAQRLAQTSIDKMFGGSNVDRDLSAINAIPLVWSRIGSDWSTNFYDYTNLKATPEFCDEQMKLCFKHKLKPLMQLIQYTKYETNALGPAQKWYDVGRAMAERFRPGSAWNIAQGHGTEFGLQYYELWNETWGDWAYIPLPTNEEFYDITKAFADGVHSIDPSLKVGTGDALIWHIKAVKDLYNNGTLNLLDLHFYYDSDKGGPGVDNAIWFKKNCQGHIDEFLEVSGITSNTWELISTEYCSQYNVNHATEEVVKRWLYTLTFELLGAVDQNGIPVTTCIMPWNHNDIFNATSTNNFGFAKSRDPWIPAERGKVLQMIPNITKDMKVISSDPRKTGEMVLLGGDKKGWVWHNITNMTDHLGTTYSVKDIPCTAKELKVYRYNSWTMPEGQSVGVESPYRTISLTGENTITLTDLPTEETLLFIASGTAPERTVYNGPHTIPGTIEAEDFDAGCQGVTYNDTDVVNKGGVYRNTAVDVKLSADNQGAYQVSHAVQGEWLEYTINNSVAGNYDINLRATTAVDGSKVKISLNGNELAIFSIPNTNNWDSLQTYTINNVPVPQTTNGVLRVEFINQIADINWISFSNTKSINEINQVTLFPNPTNSSFKIEGVTTPFSYQLYNSRGRLVFKKENQNSEDEINVASLSPGIYLIKIVVNKNIYNKKIVVSEK